MAFGKIFYTSYKSYNGWEYYMEFFVRDYTGAPSEISLGQGGPVISYDTDTEDRDNPILASQMEIPFIVNTGSQNSFIDNLRDTYKEQDVYVHLYKSTSANVSPLWSGFLLMDLSDKEDVWYPFEVKLKATDGIALLKDRDFVKDGATKPYINTDMNWGPGRFTYWIGKILQKVGSATSAEGSHANPHFRTSVNWYNSQHTGTGQSVDPLYNTQVKASWTHESDDNGNYTPMSCYDVLKELMKSWHCRIVYWNHVFWIIQIPEYNALPGGTNLNPDNIPTRIYTLGGTPNGDEAYVGSLYNSIYQLSTGVEIEKLTGTKYQFYPRLKSVTAQYQSGGGTNYYGGFPTYNGTTLDSPYAQQTIIDASFADELYLAIPLNLTKNFGSGDSNVHFYFDLKATNGTTTKYLKRVNSTYSWATSLTTVRANKAFWSGTVYGNNAQQVVGFDQAIPTDASFTGAWDFELILDDSNWGDSSLSTFRMWDTVLGYGASIYDPNSAFGVTGQFLIWSNIPGINNPFEGQFLTLNSSSGVNIAGQSILVETALSDSANHDFEQMQFGDSQDATDPGNLSVWDGAAWVQTDFTGQWGVGTLTGTDSFTNLLLEQYIKGQASNIQIINTRLMVSVSTKDNNDGTLTVPNFINPVGRIREAVLGDINYYIFRRGSFSTATDEWDFEGWSIKDETPGTTTTTTTVWGPNGPMEDDNGTMGF